MTAVLHINNTRKQLAIHRSLARYVNFRVAYAPGMPVTFSPPLRVNDPDMHHGTCVTSCNARALMHADIVN